MTMAPEHIEEWRGLLYRNFPKFQYDEINKLCDLALKALSLSPEGGFASHWRDPKVTVPCDGDDVIGLWDGRYEKNVPDAVRYFKGHWSEPGNPVNECEAPKLWMPLPPLPQKD